MPRIKANQITMHYEQQGSGEPLVLIPYLAADHACYAFQVAEYAQHFTCLSLDLRGTGETDKPDGVHSVDRLCGQCRGLPSRARNRGGRTCSGILLGAFVGPFAGGPLPGAVPSLSLHSTKSEE